MAKPSSQGRFGPPKVVLGAVQQAWLDICWVKWLIVWAMWDKIRISVVQAGRAGVMTLFSSGSCLINIAGRACCSSLSNVVSRLWTVLREVLLSFKFPWSRSGWCSGPACSG